MRVIAVLQRCCFSSCEEFQISCPCSYTRVPLGCQNVLILVLSGTKYRGTQGGGTNNHRTLKTPERTRAPLRFLPKRREFGSASPDARGPAPPHPTAGGRLRLARRLRAWLRLARGLRARLRLARPPRYRLRLARPRGLGSASTDPRGMGSTPLNG